MSTDPQSADFPEAKQFLQSRNRTTIKKQSAQSRQQAEEKLVRHFVTSWELKDKSDQAMAQIIQAHWCCESRHWQRDACWREDKCLLRSPIAACALALLRATLQSLVRWVRRESLPAVFEDVAHDLSLGLGWLKSRHLDGTIQLKSRGTVWSDCFCETKQICRASTRGEPNGAVAN